MSKVKLQVLFKSLDGETFTRLFAYINPNADNEKLVEFCGKIKNLTTNSIVEINKLVQRYISDDPG